MQSEAGICIRKSFVGSSHWCASMPRSRRRSRGGERDTWAIQVWLRLGSRPITGSDEATSDRSQGAPLQPARGHGAHFRIATHLCHYTLRKPLALPRVACVSDAC